MLEGSTIDSVGLEYKSVLPISSYIVDGFEVGSLISYSLVVAVASWVFITKRSVGWPGFNSA